MASLLAKYGIVAEYPNWTTCFLAPERSVRPRYADDVRELLRITIDSELMGANRAFAACA